jgi:hypothetical protein
MGEQRKLALSSEGLAPLTLRVGARWGTRPAPESRLSWIDGGHGILRSGASLLASADGYIQRRNRSMVTLLSATHSLERPPLATG